MSSDRLAFFIGLLGSLHCVGMCGPLAFAVPSFGKGSWMLLLDKLIYQLGRIISYCFLGLLIGLIGRQLWLADLQQVLSVLTGVLILCAAGSRILKYSIFKGNSQFLLKPFNKIFSYALKHKANHLIIGMLNGLLPCGFVYLALAGAVNTPSLKNAVSYMFWFGLGTVPLMLAATLSMSFSGQLFRNRINKFMPYMMLVLGIWFIVRGLSLDIPYLSPAKQTSSAVICK